MAKRFAILGAGAWGTAIALLLGKNPEHQVSLWSARAENAQDLREKRENIRLLPGVQIPEEIHLTAEIAEAVEQKDLIIVAIPTAFLREVFDRIAKQIPAAIPMLSLVKGIERDTFLRPSEIMDELTGPRPLAVLSGPSHAEEVSRGLPTSVVVASEDLSLAKWVQAVFSSEQLRIYTNLDVLGVEIAAAVKNIIAIAAGVSDGLNLGDNAKSALITRGLVEMTRFGMALGAEAQTFYGLAGIGDLMTTCFSRHSRNREVGELIGKGTTLKEILANMTKVAEGIYTTQSVHTRAVKMGIAMPITSAVYETLYNEKLPQDAVTDLMLRKPKSEK